MVVCPQSPSTSERRTLPNDLPGPSHVRRRAFQKRSSSSPQESGLQTSCSLPETPIFARGCDIPRTPHRRAPDVPPGSSGSMRAGASGTSSSAAGTATRPGGLHTSSYRKMGPGGLGMGTGVSLDSGGLGQALVGAELLRLTGGPGRGWYPRHRTPRPASIEHLDRVATQRSPGPWDARDARKPMTLPPNMTPKFFHRSPRDALRRVTSLLIRGKGESCAPRFKPRAFDGRKWPLPPPSRPAVTMARSGGREAKQIGRGESLPSWLRGRPREGARRPRARRGSSRPATASRRL